MTTDRDLSLPADNSHERSCLLASFEKAAKFETCLLQIIGGAFWVQLHKKKLYRKILSSTLIELPSCKIRIFSLALLL